MQENGKLVFAQNNMGESDIKIHVIENVLRVPMRLLPEVAAMVTKNAQKCFWLNKLFDQLALISVETDLNEHIFNGLSVQAELLHF